VEDEFPFGMQSFQGIMLVSGGYQLGGCQPLARISVTKISNLLRLGDARENFMAATIAGKGDETSL